MWSPAAFMYGANRYFVRDTGAKYCDQHVCLSSCMFAYPFARISRKTISNFTKFSANATCDRGSVFL